jgi:acyl-CoA thioester hydrolase
VAPDPSTDLTETLRIRVRYCDVDRMGYLWHGHYLAYFEEARTAWLRSRGASYRALEDAGVLLVVAEAEVTFRRPAAYDDVVEVSARLVEARGARLTFLYEVRRGPTLLARGRTLLASTDRRGRPCRLPGEILALTTGLPDDEAGTPPPPDGVQGSTEVPRT